MTHFFTAAQRERERERCSAAVAAMDVVCCFYDAV